MECGFAGSQKVKSRKKWCLYHIYIRKRKANVVEMRKWGIFFFGKQNLQEESSLKAQMLLEKRIVYLLLFFWTSSWCDCWERLSSEEFGKNRTKTEQVSLRIHLPILFFHENFSEIGTHAGRGKWKRNHSWSEQWKNGRIEYQLNGRQQRRNDFLWWINDEMMRFSKQHRKQFKVDDIYIFLAIESQEILNKGKKNAFISSLM